MNRIGRLATTLAVLITLLFPGLAFGANKGVQDSGLKNETGHQMILLAKAETGKNQASEAMAGGSPNTAFGSGSSEKLDLVPKGKLAELDRARHREIKEEKVALAEDTGGFSMLWGIVIVVAVLGLLGALASRSSLFNNLRIAGKLGFGFGVVVLLALTIGIAGSYFLNFVNEKMGMAARTMELDMNADEAGGIESQFVLYGIENAAKGEALVAEHSRLMEEFSADLEGLKAHNLDQSEKAAVDKMKGLLAKYEKGFEELVGSYHVIEADKEELRQISDQAVE